MYAQSESDLLCRLIYHAMHTYLFIYLINDCRTNKCDIFMFVIFVVVRRGKMRYWFCAQNAKQVFHASVN